MEIFLLRVTIPFFFNKFQVGYRYVRPRSTASRKAYPTADPLAPLKALNFPKFLIIVSSSSYLKFVLDRQNGTCLQ